LRDDQDTGSLSLEIELSGRRENEEMNYTANNLNQYTQRTVPDGIDVIGSAETNATVTVNNATVSRHNKYWHKALTVANGSSAAFQDVSVVGVYNPPGMNDPDIVSTATGHVFVAKTPETFTYDDDGNMLSDSRFNYSLDCENRLIGAETLANLPSSVPRKKVEFAYDYMSRRVNKKVYALVTNNWSLITDHFFTYDGWNLIREVGRTVPGAPSTHVIQGKLNINPNNSPQNEFVLTLPGGQVITRDNLTKDFAGYSGPAAGIHVKPKGNGKQTGLLVDGAPYEIDKSKAYDIASGAMTVHVYNDSVKKGKAMGQWWIEIAATSATITVGDQERSTLNASPSTNFYVWGLDLSGSLQGAGGIGGLVSVTRSTSSGTATYFPCYDGNGNITDYVDTNGVVVVHREYDPFGNTIVATGPMVNDFNFWFSTKYLDQETGLYYYGYRYYSPSLGRWLARDPIGERGFQSVLSSINNNASTIPSSIIHGRSKLERPQLCQKIIDELHLDVFEGKNEEALIYSAYQYLSKMNSYISRLYSIGQGFQAQQLQYNAQHLEQYINWMRLQSLAEQKNLYAFVRNSPVDSIDLLGLMEATICMDKCDEVVEKTKMPCPDMWIKRCYSWCLMPDGPPPIPFPWPLP